MIELSAITTNLQNTHTQPTNHVSVGIKQEGVCIELPNLGNTNLERETLDYRHYLYE